MNPGELRDNALNYRQIFLWGEINDETAHNFIQEMSYLVGVSHKPIVIAIHSGGGDVESEIAIIDEMLAARRIGIQVSTIALGVAYSAAASILALGSKGYRYIRPNGAVMLHPCMISLQEDYEPHQKILLDFLSKSNDKIAKLVAEACGMKNDYKKFINDIDKGLWLDSKEAVKYGIVDKIWLEPLPIGGIDNADNEEKRIE